MKYILRIFAGLAHGHASSQLAIAERALPLLHRLEQISSTEHIGSLAENVVEILKENPEVRLNLPSNCSPPPDLQVATRIERVRDETRAKKRQMAMAMREQQLRQLGQRMRDNLSLHPPRSSETNLLSCCICRDESNASRVLAVYAFAARFQREDGTKQAFSYSTVSQMNAVHVECHQHAIR